MTGKTKNRLHRNGLITQKTFVYYMMRLLERVLCLMLVSAASLRPFDKHISTPAVNHIENGLPRIYRKITRILAAGALLY